MFTGFKQHCHYNSTGESDLSATLPFAVTIFLSAFLLFQVQPLITRHILPWFGGTPAVWSAALLFFQTLLLAGYAYAHLLSRGSSIALNRRKRMLHASLLVSAVLVLLLSAFAWGAPLLPDGVWRPPDSSLPLLRVFVVLLVSVGLPYFVLSTTSPLVQSWFHLIHPDRSPYWLYALSNLGSFLALLTYPVVFETLLDLPQQTMLWSAGFLIFVVLNLYLFIRVIKTGSSKMKFGAPEMESGPPLMTSAPPQGKSGAPQVKSGALLVQPLQESLADDETNPERPKATRMDRLLWLLIPTCTTILLIAVTSYLTQEVAVIPFLWVLPLGIYLFSFTLTFNDRSIYQPFVAVVLLGIAILLFIYTYINLTTVGIFAQIIASCFFLLMATTVCHGELYRLRPSSDHLTSFYLVVSLGGVIGGLLVNLVAPLVFDWYWELPLGVFACWLLVVVLFITNRGSFIWRRFGWLAVPVLLGILVVSGYFFFRDYQRTLNAVLTMQRNFYGVLRVRRIQYERQSQADSAQNEPPLYAYSLSHGITSHGFQFIDPEIRDVPTAYYGPQSGIGLAIRNYRRTLPAEIRPNHLKVGVVGLGTGTIAAFGNEGDTYRFYEINPAVTALAKGENGYFSFLEDSPASIEIVPGDARVSLEQELARGQPQDYDILAVDAFSGDSIPVHLLTVEAFETYLRHLKPQGVLAVHISNRYLDLEPLLYSLAEHFGLETALIVNPRTDSGSYTAVWVLMTYNKGFLETNAIQRFSSTDRETDPWMVENRTVRLWTDAYSNLFQFLRLEGAFKIK